MEKLSSFQLRFYCYLLSLEPQAFMLEPDAFRLKVFAFLSASLGSVSRLISEVLSRSKAIPPPDRG